ncbi:MAG TPA: carboxypeptidase-like regulatory domain-containing protein [Pyrinomonadaceae bacterium]|nr:carboxypeptidase-like regulatory domain-containing protein [Pyrinomonadaceae bacterium]
MNVSGEEALSKALEMRDRANEELIGTVVSFEQFRSAPTAQQLELKRRFEVADQEYNRLLVQLPPSEELVLQPVDVVTPIWGVSAPEVLVWTTSFGELPAERAYLFYAKRPFPFAPDIVLPEQEPLDPAQLQGALTFLEQAVAAKNGASVYGSLVLEENVPKLGTKRTRLAGVRVHLEVDDKIFEGVTRSNGTFRFTGVPPGLTKIEATLPEGLTIQNVTRENHGVGCFPVELRARLNGRIRGRVLDESGRPVSYERVVLQDLQNANGYHAHATTNAEGAFQMTSVQPGTYVLGVNLVDKPSCTLPFPPVFHPGTIVRADATRIVVGRGTVHDGLEFSLTGRSDSLSAVCETSSP